MSFISSVFLVFNQVAWAVKCWHFWQQLPMYQTTDMLAILPNKHSCVANLLLNMKCPWSPTAKYQTRQEALGFLLNTTACQERQSKMAQLTLLSHWNSNLSFKNSWPLHIVNSSTNLASGMYFFCNCLTSSSTRTKICFKISLKYSDSRLDHRCCRLYYISDFFIVLAKARYQF